MRAWDLTINWAIKLSAQFNGVWKMKWNVRFGLSLLLNRKNEVNQTQECITKNTSKTGYVCDSERKAKPEVRKGKKNNKKKPVRE